MSAPQRIQRRRVKGWRKPEGAVIVDRTSRWGNPFTIASCIEYGFATTADEARAACVKAFQGWLDGEPQWDTVEPDRREWILANVHTLAGKTLACTCLPDQLCHGDDLAARAAVPDRIGEASRE